MENRFKEKTTEQRRGKWRVKNELQEKETNLPSGKAFAKRRDQIPCIGFSMAIDSQAQLRLQRLPLNVLKFKQKLKGCRCSELNVPIISLVTEKKKTIFLLELIRLFRSHNKS